MSLEDLKDALANDSNQEDSESDFKPANRAESTSNKKMTTSLNVTFDEESLIPSATARENIASGTSVGSTSDGSSVGNSPNPKKNKGKSKKKKRR